jgi:hypothetical protein
MQTRIAWNMVEQKDSMNILPSNIQMEMCKN